MMSIINPNTDTPMIKMMMSERIPPTTKVDAVRSATLGEEHPTCGHNCGKVAILVV